MSVRLWPPGPLDDRFSGVNRAHRAAALQSQGRRGVALLLVLLLCVAPTDARQPPLDARVLAEYRLTAPVFKRFAHATKLIAAALARDPRLVREPLFTKDVTVSGDAPAMAARLQQRLDTEPAFAAALFAADIDAREYTIFALSLFAARLAHGFLTSGALRRVSPGVASDNVAFVRANDSEVTELLKQLQLE